MEGRQIVIRGRVQGVGFRWSMRTFAREHNLTGRVGNRSDGAVVAVVFGKKSQIDALVVWCKNSSLAGAVVDSVEEKSIPFEDINQFEIIP